MGPIDIPLDRLALSLACMAVLFGISLRQRFGLERTVLWASARCAIQLLLVGALLREVFAMDHWAPVLLVLLAMGTVAGVTGSGRVEVRLPRKAVLLTASVIASTALTLVVGLVLVIRPARWWEPQFLIPLTGIYLGNAMNSAALGAERLSAAFKTSRAEVETWLALGFPPAHACHRLRREAFRAALLPTLNVMFIVGVAQLPGVMTGQMMSGDSPYIAAKYQIFIMFTYAFAVTLAASFTCAAVWRMHFNAAWQVRDLRAQ